MVTGRDEDRQEWPPGLADDQRSARHEARPPAAVGNDARLSQNGFSSRTSAVNVIELVCSRYSLTASLPPAGSFSPGASVKTLGQTRSFSKTRPSAPE